jgi:hypothetical protein
LGSFVTTSLINETQRRILLENGARRQAGGAIDAPPVVKLFTPDANATWLLVELDPEDPDLAFGLCDLGLGEPELGSVRISELSEVRGGLGLPIERDFHFQSDVPVSIHAASARRTGRIEA